MDGTPTLTVLHAQVTAVKCAGQVPWDIPHDH
jgi:hypothetical protein